MCYSANKDIDSLCKAIANTGILTFVKGGKHPAFVRKDGNKAPIPTTPSDYRSFENFKSQMKRFCPDVMEMISNPLTIKAAPTLDTKEYFAMPAISSLEQVQVPNYLEDMSIAELEILLKNKKQKFAEERESRNAQYKIELAEIDVKILETKTVLEGLQARRMEIRKQMGSQAVPIVKADIPKTSKQKKVEAAIEDPVFKANGKVDLLKTCLKHGLVYNTDDRVEVRNGLHKLGID